MNAGDEFEVETSRTFEILCGVILLLFACLIATGAVLTVLNRAWTIQVGAIALVLATIAWGLGTVGTRLILGKERTKKDLFSTAGLYVAAAMFIVGGTALVVTGINMNRPPTIFYGVGAYSIAYYIWRSARRRGARRAA